MKATRRMNILDYRQKRLSDEKKMYLNYDASRNDLACSLTQGESRRPFAFSRAATKTRLLDRRLHLALEGPIRCACHAK